jgi:hypothetical protein
MYTGLKHLHSFWPYILLSLTVLAALVFAYKWLGKKTFSESDRKLSLFTLIAAHLQFVFGLVLYFISPVAKAARNTPNLMADADARFYAVEHISVMILAIVVITIGNSKAKKIMEPGKKFRTLTLLFLLALVLMLSRIPWNTWPNFMV